MVLIGPLCKVACNGLSARPNRHTRPADKELFLQTSSLRYLAHIVFRVGVPELVAAVSNAGGLGILTALTQPNPDALREAIRKTRKLTDKPFGVNITFLPAITPPDYEGYARAAVEEGVRVFETAGNNREFLVARVIIHSDEVFMRALAGPFVKYFKQNGCTVIHKCEHSLT